MEVEMNATKEKLEASKSRNKVLTNENKTLKEQVRTLLEKGKHDDELVDALLVWVHSYNYRSALNRRPGPKTIFFN